MRADQMLQAQNLLINAISPTLALPIEVKETLKG